MLLAFADGKRPVEGEDVERAWADLQQLPTPWQEALSAPKQNTGPHNHPGKPSTGVIEFGELNEDTSQHDETPAATGDGLEVAANQTEQSTFSPEEVSPLADPLAEQEPGLEVWEDEPAEVQPPAFPWPQPQVEQVGQDDTAQDDTAQDDTAQDDTAQDDTARDDTARDDTPQVQETSEREGWQLPEPVAPATPEEEADLNQDVCGAPSPTEEGNNEDSVVSPNAEGTLDALQDHLSKLQDAEAQQTAQADRQGAHPFEEFDEEEVLADPYADLDSQNGVLPQLHTTLGTSGESETHAAINPQPEHTAGREDDKSSANDDLQVVDHEDVLEVVVNPFANLSLADVDFPEEQSVEQVADPYAAVENQSPPELRVHRAKDATTEAQQQTLSLSEALKKLDASDQKDDVEIVDDIETGPDAPGTAMN